MSRGFSPAVSTGLDKPSSTYAECHACAVIEPAALTLKLAIFYSEHPRALMRDYPSPTDQARALRRMDRLFAAATREQPLEWQAYLARCRKRAVIGTEEAARRIVAFKQLGVRIPVPPPTPAR
jgi:hypothetical protein